METKRKLLRAMGIIVVLVALPVVMGAVNQYSMNQLLAYGSSSLISGFQSITAAAGQVQDIINYRINGDYNAKASGAKGGNQVNLTGGALTGSTFVRSDGGSFVAADVGKTIDIVGAGANFNALETTISVFTNSTTVTLTASAVQNVSGKSWSYGWDDTAAIQSCLTAAGQVGKDCYLPNDRYHITNLITGDTSVSNTELHTQTIGTGDGATRTFSGTLTISTSNATICSQSTGNPPAPCTVGIARDSVFVSEENIVGNTGRVGFVDEDDNGTGTFYAPSSNTPIGTINYTTGAIAITSNGGFPTAPASGAPVVVTYYLRPINASPQQTKSQAGLFGSGPNAAYLDASPTVRGYAINGMNTAGKQFRGFKVDALVSAANQYPAGAGTFATTNGAPSTVNRIIDIESINAQMVGWNVDLNNDSTLQTIHANGLAANNSYSIFANGNGGPEHLEDIKADHPVVIAGQEVGIYDSGLYGGVRLYSSDFDWVTIQNSQIWADEFTGSCIDTLTGVSNAGIAQGLDLTNVQLNCLEGSGDIAGHWWAGGTLKGVSWSTSPAFSLTQGPGNGNLPLWRIAVSGAIGGNGRLAFENASIIGKAHIEWCVDGTENCSYNYDNISSTGTTFAGIGTPNAPTVTQLGTPGAGTCTYFQVDVGRNGKDSIPSTGTTINNCSASLATNNVKVCPSYNAGATSYKILKTNTSTQLGTVDAGGGTTFPSLSGCFLDTGQGTSAYVPTTVDQTDIMNSASSASPFMMGWGGVVKQAGAPGAAIGGGKCEFFAVAGTGGGTCKLQVICGTSTTPVTIQDNIGAGC